MPHNLRFPPLVLLLFILLVAYCVGSTIAQPVAAQNTIYFSASSIAELDPLNPSACTRSAPCRFANSTDRWTVSLTTSANLVFLAGTYDVPYLALVGAPGHQLNVSTLGHVIFNSSDMVQFGDETDPPNLVKISDAHITLTGTRGLAVAASTSALFAHMEAHIDGPCTEVVVVGLQNDGNLVSWNSTFTMKHNNSPLVTSVFYLYAPQPISLMGIYLIETRVESFLAVWNVEHVAYIGELGLHQSTFTGIGVLFHLKASQLLHVGWTSLDEVHVSGVNRTLAAFRIAVYEEAMLKDSFVDGCSMGFYAGDINANAIILRTRIQNTELLQFLAFNMTTVLGLNVTDSNLVSDSADLLIDGLKTYNSTLTLTSRYKPMVILQWLAEDTNANFSAPLGIFAAYVSFRRVSSNGHLTLNSLDVWIYDGEFYRHPRAPTHPLLSVSGLHIRLFASVDGLHLLPSSRNYSLSGDVSITYSLTADTLTGIDTSDTLTFVADPLTGDPVQIRNVLLGRASFSSNIPRLRAAVSTVNGAAAYFGDFTKIHPHEFELQVLIKNGDVNDPITESTQLLLFSGPGIEDDDADEQHHFKNPLPLAFDASYGFGGNVEYSSGKVYYHVTSYSCPNNCSGNGTCVGVNTCSCPSGSSGHTCQCNNLPFGASCPSDYEDRMTLAEAVQTAPGDDATIGSWTLQSGAGINNRGSLALKNGNYEFQGEIYNTGKLTASATVVQRLNERGDCVPSVSSRTTAPSMVLGPGSVLSLDVDISGADTAPCPKLGQNWKRDFSAAGMRSSRRAVPMEPSKSLTTSQGSTDVWADKVHAMVDVDESSFAGGTLVVNVAGSTSKDLAIQLVVTRNATDKKVILEGGAEPLKVQVNTPRGVCGSVKHEANLITLFATPCPSSPKNDSSKKNWARWGAPVITFGTLLLIILLVIILYFTIPEFKDCVRPYHDTNS